MKKVYVSGPITLGDQYLNVCNAIHAAEQLLQAGYWPFVPHLSYSWHMLYPHTAETWLEYDCQWLEQCQALLRLPGKSAGADQEVTLAEELGIPVFHSLEELMTWGDPRGPWPPRGVGL